MAGQVRHIVKRGDHYYARRVVPADLREIIGKSELREPLGSSKQGAHTKVHAAIVRFDAVLDAARAKLTGGALSKPVSRPLPVEKIAKVHYAEEIEADEDARDHPGVAAGSPELFRDAYTASLRRVASGRASDEETNAAIGWAIDKFTARRNTSVKPESVEWRQLARALAGVQLEALARSAERDQGDFSGEPKLPVLTKEEPSNIMALSGDRARVLCPESLLPLSEILPRMHAEKRNLRDSTKNEQRVAVRMFEEHRREPTPIHKITRREMLDYKRALMETPTNYSTRFPGKTLPEAIEANKRRKEPFPTLSAKTINDKWLAHLGSVFQWAADNEIIPDNPGQRVRVDEGKSAGQPPRIPFTPGDLAKIFAHPSFANAESFGERQWAVLIALFTGMRASEIAQLPLDGIRHERSVLGFTTGGELKNEGSRRFVPVHSTLLALGLERHVARLRKRGETYLFSEWHARGEAIKANAEKKGQVVQQPFAQVHPKWFNRFLLPEIGITDARKRFHSLRHTFKTGLSTAGVSREISDLITGHNDRSAGAGYVHAVSVERIKRAIESLHFDGLSELAKKSA